MRNDISIVRAASGVGAAFALALAGCAHKPAAESNVTPYQEPASAAPSTEPVEGAGTGDAVQLQENAPMHYVVQKGDTLWSIAKKKEYFGQGHRWYDIWKANEDSIADFDRLETGTNITIPLDKPDTYPWPKTSDEKRKALLEQPGPVVLDSTN